METGSAAEFAACRRSGRAAQNQPGNPAVKLVANRIDAFVSNVPKPCPAVLIYGPDHGLISVRAEAIAKQIVPDLSDPFRVAEISPARLKEDGALLTDELGALSFMGGRKLVRVREADAASANAIAEALATIRTDGAFLIVTAGDLTPTSALRKAFESHPEAAAIPCYVEDERALAGVVRTLIKDAGFEVDNDAVDYIASHSQGDRLMVSSEVEKLLIYKGEDNHVSLEDVERVVGDATESSLQDVINGVAAGDYANVEKHLRKALHQGVAPIALLRAAESYFIRLYEIAAAEARGVSRMQAVETSRPPVFFKQKPLLMQHASRWCAHPQATAKAIEILYVAEAECKRTGADAELIAANAFLRIAGVPTVLARKSA
ncbi:MAG: DNA polymerase III subunit delta [Proteobacteria bacterium]|nr:DNA polymerase III subunit delta [Pseudomonadota bacterium]